MADNENNHISLAEARKRLGRDAPGESTFYKAVSEGKITKVPADKSAGKCPQLFSWPSVQEWNQDRLKRQDKRRKKRQDLEPERALAESADTDDDSFPQPSDSGDSPESANLAADKVSQGQEAPASADRGARTAAAGRPGSTPTKCRRKPKTPSAPSKSAKTAKAPSKRRVIPMRKVKNTLRGLSFGEALDLRNWLDNRLLYKLKPETSAPAAAAPEPVKK